MAAPTQDPITVTGVHPNALPDPSAEGRPQLVVMVGNEPGRLFTFEGSCTIGRSQECEIRFDDPGLSRCHLRLERVRRNTYRIKDLGSSNGTRVDGESVQECEITAGATIQLGRSTTLRFLIQDPMERELEEATKLDFVTRLAAGLTHDFNNLVFAITSNISYLRGMPGDATFDRPDVRDCLLDLMASGEQAFNLVRHLAAITKTSSSGQARCELSGLLARTADLVKRNLPRNVLVRTRIQAGLSVMGDDSCLEQLLLAPCFNARDAMPQGGVLDIAAELELREDRGAEKRWVVITIRDNGQGMNPAVLARAFEPLFTTKPGARGLGLSTTRKIAQDHGGRVRLESTVGAGTTLTIELPAVDAPAEEDARVTLSTPDELYAPVTYRVLVADDEPGVARALFRVLRRSGYDVTLAQDGQEAYDLYMASPGKFDVVLLDVDMPRMTGPECFARLRAAHPDVRVILMSGLWRREPALVGELAEARAFLHKPVEPQVLEQTLASVLAPDPESQPD